MLTCLDGWRVGRAEGRLSPSIDYIDFKTLPIYKPVYSFLTLPFLVKDILIRAN